MFFAGTRAFARAVVVGFLSLSIVSSSIAQSQEEDPRVSYTYDDLGRLTSVVYLNDGRTYHYTYDAAGNRTEHEVVSGTEPSVYIGNTHAFEGNRLWFGIWMSTRSTQDVVVNYEIVAGGGSASAADYEALSSGSRTIKAGDTSTSFYIQTVEDEDDEPEETVHVQITSVTTGAAVLSPTRSLGVGRIKNDDGDIVNFTVSSTLTTANGKPLVGAQEGQDLVFPVTIEGTPLQSYTVDYELVQGSATEGADYIAQSGTLTFQYREGGKSDTVKNVVVSTLDDDLYEVYEDLQLKLKNPSEGAAIGQILSVGRISDKADRAYVRVSAGSLIEGDSGDRFINHALWLTHAAKKDVVVEYYTRVESGDDRASEDDFYVIPESSPASVTIPAGEGGATLQIQIKPDTIDEEDESYTLVLKSVPSNNAWIGQGAKAKSENRGLIRDDDDPRALFNINNASATEGSNVVFHVNRAGNTSNAYTVNYTISHISTDEGDVTAGNGSFTVSAGVDQVDLVVPTKNDSGVQVYEGNEAFMVEIDVVGCDQATCGITDTRGSGSITDNDQPGITLDGASLTASEDDAFAIDVELTGVSAIQAQVIWGVALSSNPTSSEATIEDFDTTEFPLGGVLVFEPGEVVKTIELQPFNDVTAENNETFQLVLTQSKVAMVPNGSVSYTATITNDDDGTGTMFEATTVAVSENEVMTTELEPVEGATPTGKVLNLKTGSSNSPRAAMPSQDFEPSSQAVTFDETASVRSFTIRLIDDEIKETSEEVPVQISMDIAGTNDIVRMVGGNTILDNDTGPEFSVTNLDITEDGFAVFTVSKLGSSDGIHAVSYYTTDGSAVAGEDYLSQQGLLTFGPDDYSQQVIVDTLGDTLFEPTEEFYLDLSAPTNGAVVEEGRGVATITDDDIAATVSILDAQSSEGEDIVFTLLLDRQSAVKHTIDFSTANGSAWGGIDFGGSSGTVEFLPGTDRATITIKGQDDSVDEGQDETFTVYLENPTAGLLLGDIEATGTILENDGQQEALNWPPAPLTCDVKWDAGNMGAEWAVDETGLIATYTNSSTTESGIMANTGVSSGKWYWEVSSDRTSSVDWGGIAPEGTPTAVDDFHNQLNVWFGNHGTVDATFRKGSGSGNDSTLLNWDGANRNTYSFALDVDASRIVVRKNGGSAKTFVLDASVQKWFPILASRKDQGQAIVANFGATSFAYGVPSGYSAYNEACVAIDPNVTDGTTVTDGQMPAGDTRFGTATDASTVFDVPAGKEISIALGGGAGGFGDSGLRTAGHGGEGVFRFVATNGFKMRLRVGKEGGFDQAYNGTPKDANGAMGGGNDTGEGGGATAIVLSSDGVTWTPVAIVGGGGGGGDNTGGGNGGGLDAVGVAGESKTYEGGGGGTLSAPGLGARSRGGDGGTPGNAGNASISGSTAGLGDATFGIGGGGSGDGTSTGGGGGGGGRFGGGGGTDEGSAGETGGGGGSGYFDAAAIEAITGGVPAILANTTGGNDGDGYVFVGVDDAPPPPPDVSVNMMDASGEEGGELIFIITATGTTDQAVTIGYQTVDGTALAGSDYPAASGTISFSVEELASAQGGIATKLLSIPATEDADKEESETFTIQLTLNSGDAELVRSAATATIYDDDEPPVFSILEDSVAYPEGDVMVFSVEKNMSNENSYSVSYETVAGTAVDGSDYDGTSGTLVFDADTPMQTVTVVTHDDEVGSGNRDFLFRIKDATGGATIDRAEITATIQDNDLQYFTETISADQTWVAPAGIVELAVLTGKGENGTAGSWTNTSAQLSSFYKYTEGGSSAAHSHAVSQFSKFSGLSTSTASTVSYVERSQTWTAVNTYNRSKTVRAKSGGPTKIGAGWTTSVASGDTYYATLTWSVGNLEYYKSGTNGKNTTGFGKTFSGGNQKNAVAVTYTNVPVTAGQSYVIDIAPGGYITIEYWAVQQGTAN